MNTDTRPADATIDIHPTTVIADGATQRRISWGAIFAGTLIALVGQLLLSLLGIGIGLSTINPMSEGGNPAAGLGMGAGIWWIISSLIALYAGGWVAGRLAGIPRTTDSTLHGLLTWGLATLATFYLITTSIGALISGATGVVGKGLSLAGQGVAAAAPQAAEMVKGKMNEQGIDLSSIQQEAETLLRQTGKPALQPENLQNQAEQAGNQAQGQAQAAAANPQGAEMNLNALMKTLSSEGSSTMEAADRDAAVNVVVARTGKSRPEAEKIVDGWITTAQQAKQKLAETKAQAEQKAREVGEATASGLSKASLLAFFGLVLGAAAAAFGGRSATPDALREDLAVAR
jgi:hypothetical protein